jgi:hypothetical protein
MNTDHPAIVALVAVLQKASEEFSAPVSEIAVRRMEARKWRDGCLELPENGCPDVVTPGFRIELDSAGAIIAYRTDMQGKVRREPAGGTEPLDLVVDFIRTGGFTGRERSESHFATATMPAAEAEELKRLVAQADFWNLPTSIDSGDPIPDGYDYGVSVTADSRHHAVNAYDGTKGFAAYPGFGELLGWLSARTPSQFGEPELSVAAAE